MITLLLALSCAEAPRVEPPAPLAPSAPPALPAPPPPPPAPPPPPLAEVRYAPGPGGDVASAAFSVPAPGTLLYAAGERVSLRAGPGGAVLRALSPGEGVVVEAVVGEPVVVDGRRDTWLRVTAGGEGGVVFGGDLTPLGAAADPGTGSGERWTVSFDAGFRPRLTWTGAAGHPRARHASGAEVTTALPLAITGRFRGGTLRAEGELVPFADPEITVVQCPPEGADPRGPGCVTGRVRVVDRARPVQVTLPDAWENEAPGDGTCDADAPAVRPVPRPVRERLRLQLLKHLRSGDEVVVCREIGTLPSGALVSCGRDTPSKLGPSTLDLWRFVDRGDGAWTYLPCAGDAPARPPSAEAILRELGGRRIRVDVDPTVRLAGPWAPPPAEVPVARGHLRFGWRSPHTPAATRLLGEDPALGPLRAPTDPHFLLAGAVVVPIPGEGTLVYRWEPDGPVAWDGEAPASAAEYLTVERDCSFSGYPLDLDADVRPADRVPVGRLADGSPVSVVAPEHPAARRLLRAFEEMAGAEGGQLPPSLRGVPASGLWAHRPAVWVEDPWGRSVRLRRADLERAEACEPYVYVYADPGTAVSVAPVPPLAWRHTLPYGPEGWVGVARRDGRVEVGGAWHDALLWEGDAGWLPPPDGAVVVRGDEVAPLLRRAAPALGLEGREAQAFVDAWAWVDAVPWVSVGFHDPATVARRFPLAVAPPPTQTLRVLLDVTLLEEAPADGVPTGADPTWVPAAVDRGSGVVVVEWGGIVRDRR